MEEDIQNYLPTVMFRGTPCSHRLIIDACQRFTKQSASCTIVHAVYFELINQSRCRIWGCCIFIYLYFHSVSSDFGEGAGLELSNSKYGNTNILVLKAHCAILR